MINTLLPSIIILILILLSQIYITEARDRHIIKFRSSGVYPEGLTYNPTSQHFIVSAIEPGTFQSISEAGIPETLTLVSGNLPQNPTILGLEFDKIRNRLFATINTADQPYLAAFSLHRTTLSLIFISPLPSDHPHAAFANDVTLDPHGNAYVTNSGENFIWKVDVNGTASILSNSPLFTHFSVESILPYVNSGLNGIIYVDENDSSYLLVVQSSTGKMFKVDAIDGTTRSVKVPLQLTLADGITINKNGVVFVVSIHATWMLKSDDRWQEGILIDKVTLEREGFATGVSLGKKGRVYVVYGYGGEGKKVNLEGAEIEWFRIEEVGPIDENDGVWVFVMVGLGLAYFLFWKFQMGRLGKNMNKKRD